MNIHNLFEGGIMAYQLTTPDDTHHTVVAAATIPI